MLEEKIIGPDLLIEGINLCNRPTQFSSILSYITNFKFIPFVNQNQSIKALIIPYSIFESFHFKSLKNITFILTNNPEFLFYRIHEFLIKKGDFYLEFKKPSKIGLNFMPQISTYIAPNGVSIGNNVSIGHNTLVLEGSIIGNNTYIGNNTVIGSQGFQVLKINNLLVSIKHVGGVKISNNVRISDNCTVANSLFEGYTEIGEFSHIDNLVHVAHNCIIENNVCLTAGVVLSGSVTIKSNSWIGPNSTVLNKVVIGENCLIGISSNIIRNVPKNSLSFGNPSKNYSKE